MLRVWVERVQEQTELESSTCPSHFYTPLTECICVTPCNNTNIGSNPACKLCSGWNEVANTASWRHRPQGCCGVVAATLKATVGLAQGAPLYPSVVQLWATHKHSCMERPQLTPQPLKHLNVHSLSLDSWEHSMPTTTANRERQRQREAERERERRTDRHRQTDRRRKSFVHMLVSREGVIRESAGYSILPKESFIFTFEITDTITLVHSRQAGW